MSSREQFSGRSSLQGQFSARSSLLGTPTRGTGSRHLRPIATPGSAPFSLAGPTLTQAQTRRSEPRTHEGYASEEYQLHSPKHGRWSNEPLFSLAHPFPHTMRPGMRSSSVRTNRGEVELVQPTSTRQTSWDIGRSPAARAQTASQLGTTHTRDRDSTQRDPSRQNAGTQPAPQIQVTPTRNEEQFQQSGETTRVIRAEDLLRHATTANASSYGIEGHGQHAYQPSHGYRSTDAGQKQHKLEDELISAHDKARNLTRSLDGDHSEPSPDDSERTAVNLGKQPHGSLAHDFAIDRTRGLVTGHELDRDVRSEPVLDPARRRRQHGTDTVDNDDHDLHLPPTVDLEPYQTYLGQDPAHILEPDFFNRWGRIRYRLRKPLAEFLGTVVFMTIGLCGAITHMTATAPVANSTANTNSTANDNASLLMAYIAWGLGVMTAIYIAGGVSGAHLNPTISITLAIFRGFSWWDCWQYITAQLLGSITASGISYGLYRDAIVAYTNSELQKAGPAFWTQPRKGLSRAGAFFNEFVATAIVSGSVLALGDDGNAPPGAGMAAFIIGLLTIALEMAFSYNTGTCLNPARDFGPRLVTLMAGFGTHVFTLSNYWFIWGPWASTIMGGLMGATIYDALIFVGAESPINYPRGKLKQKYREKSDLSFPNLRRLSRMGRGKDTPGAAADKQAAIV